MASKQVLVLLTFLLASISADQTWYNFKTTWDIVRGFYDQPRTEAEALAAGWVQVSNNCEEGAEYDFKSFFFLV